jgi:hypothetical protein
MFRFLFLVMNTEWVKWQLEEKLKNKMGVFYAIGVSTTLNEGELGLVGSIDL